MYTPFTRTTYIRIRICILILFCSHDHITESQFSDAAAIFHVTRVRDATTMVFLNCSSCYSFFSGCEEDGNGGFRAKRRRISSCDHAYHHEKQGLPQFSGIPNRFCTLRPNETGSYRLPKYSTTQQFLHRVSVVLDMPSCQHPPKTSGNAKSGFTDECGFKTTSEAGLQPGF